MGLESISKQENLINKGAILWGEEIAEIGENYLKKNEIAMDAKMYFALNQLYLKKKRDKNLN